MAGPMSAHGPNNRKIFMAKYAGDVEWASVLQRRKNEERVAWRKWLRNEHDVSKAHTHLEQLR